MNRQEIIKFIGEIKPQLIEQLSIEKIGLFGSVAKGIFNESSDIDVLVSFKENTPRLYEKKTTLRKLISRRFNRKVDICNLKYIKPYYREVILKEALFV